MLMLSPGRPAVDQALVRLAALLLAVKSFQSPLSALLFAAGGDSRITMK
jgi:hypothetical protein